ncbi:YceD family protein [Clostridium sp. Cult3]|uniref:YceD family protein n=1 Tax=Clostridium sp. Cult3 TaxID=2079004 RepID=UPI001F40B844|nr:DUF177 domain-containing protein [Clostridium sp. Cult3]MCF6461041.1 hypothetical protein [Clostridium sp. Cult3]
MSIDLSDFREEAVLSIQVEGELDKDALKINGRKIKFLKPIEYKGDIFRTQGDKIVHIDIHYEYEEACGRCLTPFSREKDTVLSGRLINDSDEILDDEDEVIYYKGEELDLTEDIMDMVILSLPMKPLCNEDCKGLCPKCGINLNKEECDCVLEEIDPRLEKLKDFFPKE